MMADAKNGDLQAILLFDISRLTRNYRDGLILLLLLYLYGVQIISVAAPPIKDFTSLLLLADYESDLIGQKTRTGLEAAAAKGRHTGGKPPFGYRLDENKQLVIVPEKRKSSKKFLTSTFPACRWNRLLPRSIKWAKQAGREETLPGSACAISWTMKSIPATTSTTLPPAMQVWTAIEKLQSRAAAPPSSRLRILKRQTPPERV